VPPDAESDTIRQERDELRELAQRVQADFENYRKRMLREQTERIERANEQLVGQLLPVLDSFELALQSLRAVDEGVRKGVELVYSELIDVLEKAGVEPIETDGKPFDPNVHEAVMQEDGDGEPVVVDTMRAGYRLKGRVVRPAMVKVARTG
jgi:molecular chaperone GrpE